MKGYKARPNQYHNDQVNSKKGPLSLIQKSNSYKRQQNTGERKYDRKELGPPKETGIYPAGQEASYKPHHKD